MDTEDLYRSVSAWITAEVLGREEHSASYFDALRTVVDRVVTLTDENCLGAEEKNSLVQRLMEHVSSLEACLT